MSIKTVRRITAKVILGDVKAAHDEDRARFSVAGEVLAVKTKAGAYDRESVAFHGHFVARNDATGEEFSARQLFLPGIAEEMVRERFNGEPLEIGFRVYTVASDSSATGYAFEVDALFDVEPAEKDQRYLTMLGEAPALPVPTKATAKTPAKTPAKATAKNKPRR